MTIPGLSLSGGGAIPAIGLGLWKVEPDRAPALVKEAILTGYRHLDCACDYGNEAQVGAGLQAVWGEGLCRREDVFVTSKLWNTYHRPEHVRAALNRTLNDLQLDYLDLFLIHFPISLNFVPFAKRYPPGWFFDPDQPQPGMVEDRVPIAETWRAMEELVQSGYVQHIGVCNFGCSLLRDLLSYAKIHPSVLQVESHPFLTQEKLLRFCHQERVVFTAFSPLGSISYEPLGMASPADSIMNLPAVQDLARKHGKTPAQILLRWGVQRRTVVIPKTSRSERLRENLNVFDFELAEDEMHQVAGLNQNRRFNDPGVFCEQAFHTFFPIYE
ncbi:MAG: aldo/keto reductase [Pirellulaceae bacterium]|jgi:D-xylose reductase|nr:aldo/keto reductase [Pirellulaceae bacterium]